MSSTNPILERAPKRSRQLAELLNRLLETQTEPLWPGLRIVRTTRPTEKTPSVYQPGVCLVAQGAKAAQLGDRIYRYDPLSFLIIGAPLPVKAHILEASPERPFLSLVLEIDSAAVHEILLQIEDSKDTPKAWDGEPPIRSSKVDDTLIEAMMRFLRALEQPAQRKGLAPSIFREIVFHLLTGEQGDILRAVTVDHVQKRGIMRALALIHRDYADSLGVSALAKTAGMSISGFHHNFKSATTMSPMQYLKRIRLERALQLMLNAECSAGEAAFKVGYASQSQFTREFKRVFGRPPKQYLSYQRQRPGIQILGEGYSSTAASTSSPSRLYPSTSTTEARPVEPRMVAP